MRTTVPDACHPEAGNGRETGDLAYPVASVHDPALDTPDADATDAPRSVRPAVLALLGLSALIVLCGLLAPHLLGHMAAEGELHVAGIGLRSRTLYLIPWASATILSWGAAVLLARSRGVSPVGTFVALGVFIGGLVVGATLQGRLEQLDVWTALWMRPQDLMASGMRFPLGILVGGSALLLFCRAVRLPWRHVGDALALMIAGMSALGRIGCLFAGCCMGAPCESGVGFCLRYPPATAPYLNQVAKGFLEPGSALSLPAHVLPAYFALTGVALLGVLLWLYARRAPAGWMLFAFGVLRPLAKIGLELLRAVPRAGPWMVVVPLATLLLTLGVAAIVWLRRSAPGEIPGES